MNEKNFLTRQRMNSIIALSIVFCASLSVWAQDANLKRDVLLTLGQNESIWVGEYFAAQYFNENRFACMIYDDVKKSYTFVFNGKRIITTDANVFDDYARNFSYLNIAEENGYVFYYTKKEDGALNYYVNYKGTTDGPFDDISLYANNSFGRPNSRIYLASPVKEYDYLYRLAGRWYAHKDGKNKKVDFAEGINDYNSKKSSVNINGSISHYDGGYDVCLTESGKYAYGYKSNGKCYVNINGDISQGDDGVGDVCLTENGKYAYRYYSNGKEYANINGDISQGYDGVGDVCLTENGKYAYRYYSNGKYYVNINGDIRQGYDRVYDVRLTESGKYAYSYESNGKWYANINGNISQGYDAVYSLTLSDNGDYTYVSRKNGKIDLNHDEKNKIDFWDAIWTRWMPVIFNANPVYANNENGIELSSINDEHSFFSAYEYEYVVIDGKRYGKSPALYAGYDKGKNVFVWNAIEGKDLVLYEYKLP